MPCSLCGSRNVIVDNRTIVLPSPVGPRDLARMLADLRLWIVRPSSFCALSRSATSSSSASGSPTCSVTFKSVAIAPAELEGALEEGIGFDGSAIEGYARIYEADMIAHPDPGTFQLLPWRTQAGTAWMFCDISMPDGSPAMADPRHVLASAQARRRHGLHVLHPPRD